MNLFSSIKLGSARLWLVASSFSLVLLALVVSQLDISRFVAMLEQIRIEFLLLAMGLLFGEGMLTALRIQLFCSGQPKWTDALLANAWYSILIVLLPARLGELAAVVVLEKLLAQKRGAAVMSIIAQRLFDIVVLGSLFMVALFTAIQILPPLLSALVSFGVIICGSLCIFCQEQMLSVLASFLMNKGIPKRRTLRRSLLRVVLQARIWRRHCCKAGLNRKALMLTSLKWLCTLAAITMLFLAISAPLASSEAIAVSAAYNFIAVIPIQTIGGLGIGEVGLATILVSMGISLSLAVAISIFVRINLIIFPFLFFSLVSVWCYLDSKALAR